MRDRSTDPNRHLLAPETDRLLDRELEEITGDPEARVSRNYRARFHAAGIGDIVELRFGLIIAALILAMVGAITFVSGGGVVVLIGVVVLLLGATAAVVVMTLRLAGPTEHPSPVLEARLVAEGVGDPDRVLTDLVHEFEQRPAVPPRPAA